MKSDAARGGGNVAAFVALAAALAAAAPLFVDPGFLNTRGGGDSPFLIFRLHQMASALADGHFPVRWMPDAAYGLGYPFFHYYAALPFYTACAFRFWGFSYVLALKLTHLVGFLGAAYAMWAWARRSLGLGQWGATLASAAYTFAPFHMVNVYVRGDSLSEFWAFLFYPLVLLATNRLIERPTARRIGLLAASYGALLLTHNISALIFTPFALLYAMIMLIRATRPSRTGRIWIGVALGFGLGLVASSWFWLPALMDRDLAQLGPVTTGYFHYSNHFRTADLVQSSAVVSYAIDGQATPFSMGLVQAVLAALGLIALTARLASAKNPDRKAPAQALFITAGLGISTLMITPLSGPLWDHLPLLPFVQFPWRFLSVQALFTAALTGYLASSMPGASRSRGMVVAMVLAVSMGASALIGLRPDFIRLSDSEVAPDRLQLYELTTGNIGTTVRHEYLPAWVNPRPYSGPEAQGESPRPKPISGQVTGTQLERSAIRQVWQLNVESEQAEVAFPLLYWPGWRATLDGAPIRLSHVPGLGWASATVPAGSHTVTLWLENTPARAMIDGIATLGTIAVVMLIAAAPRRKAKRNSNKPPARIWVKAALTVTAAVILGAALHLAPDTGPPGGPLVMDYAQEGYFHHEPDGLPFEGRLRLADYTLTPNRLRAGESLSFESRWDGIDMCGDTRCTARIWLISPAETTQGRPARLIGPTDFNISTNAEVEMQVPEWAPPGVYLLRLAVYGPDGDELRPLTGVGEPRVDMVLGPVTVEQPHESPPEAEGIADFGPLRLLAVTLEPAYPCSERPTPECDGRLNVRLEWAVTEELARNYNLGLRLRGPDGNTWAAHDAQMGNYGFYPSSLWEAGTLFRDWVQLEADPGIPPGNGYRLSIAVYDAATMDEIGRIEVEGMALPALTAAPDSEPLFEVAPGLGVLSTSGPDSVEQGEPFTVIVRWVTDEGFEVGPGRIAWRLRGTDGIAWDARTPLAPGSDSTIWPPGATIEGRIRLNPPPDVPPGNYTLEMAAPGAENWVPILEMRVTESTRLFEPPDWPGGGAEFGDMIRLWGYRIAREGDALTIEFAWGAIEAMHEDYYFFVHLFDPETDQIVAQRDAMPHDYSYPTSRWAPGEVVTDEVTLPIGDVPPGEYRLRVGWYVYGGARLAARDADGTPLPGDCLVLEGVIHIR